jgi:protein-S-isoprenylcysteine O-methyltransferase Ste14
VESPLSPLFASEWAISIWLLSWMVASVWQRRAQARPPLGEQLGYQAPLAVGALLLVIGGRDRLGAAAPLPFDPRLWRLDVGAGWALFALCLAGLAFCWWARLTLGPLWSSSVTRKEDHEIVERGPYRIVRHPIYTGLLAALASFAVQLGTPAALAGAAICGFALWRKAALEERFLIEELGPDVYGAYRRSTPMLTPFWPWRG